MLKNFSSLTLLFLIPLVACTSGSNSSSSTTTTWPVVSSGTQFQLRLGTRWMASTALQDIFGASTAATGASVQTVATQFIATQPVSWGGPCDPYANSLLMPTKQTDGSVQRVVASVSPRGCTDSSFSQSAILPGASTTRLAWTIRACDRIVSSDPAVLYAATQAGLTGSITVPPTTALIQSTYNIFYPGVPITAAVQTGLQGVVNQAVSLYPNTNEAWRYLLLTLCSSPGWQIL
jgi:hypothetical protein